MVLVVYPNELCGLTSIKGLNYPEEIVYSISSKPDAVFGNSQISVCAFFLTGNPVKKKFKSSGVTLFLVVGQLLTEHPGDLEFIIKRKNRDLLGAMDGENINN